MTLFIIAFHPDPRLRQVFSLFFYGAGFLPLHPPRVWLFGRLDLYLVLQAAFTQSYVWLIWNSASWCRMGRLSPAPSCLPACFPVWTVLSYNFHYWIWWITLIFSPTVFSYIAYCTDIYIYYFLLIHHFRLFSTMVLFFRIYCMCVDAHGPRKHFKIIPRLSRLSKLESPEMEPSTYIYFLKKSPQKTWCPLLLRDNYYSEDMVRKQQKCAWGGAKFGPQSWGRSYRGEKLLFFF